MIDARTPGAEMRESVPLHKVQEGAVEELRKAREIISGRNYRAIEVAIPELERRGLKVDDYHIVVFRMGNVIFVIFGNPDDAYRPKTGCVGPRPCFGVRLNYDDLRIIRAEFY
jgi:hypothetical protein